jgi:hypothetical protein
MCAKYIRDDSFDEPKKQLVRAAMMEWVAGGFSRVKVVVDPSTRKRYTLREATKLEDEIRNMLHVGFTYASLLGFTSASLVLLLGFTYASPQPLSSKLK